MLTLKNSYYFSLIIQLISLVLFLFTFSSEVEPHKILLKNAYNLECFVSVVELIGYFILGYYLHTKTNLTALRYGDWFVTTNMMLVSLSLFLMFNNVYYDKSLSENEKQENLKKYTFEYLQENYGTEFLKIMFFNTFMLVFGLMGELKFLDKYVSLFIGLILFGLSFYYVVTNFAENILINNIVLGVFIFIWLLYAIAFMMKFEQKNIAYNILDLISKNMFGVFLFSYMKYIV